MLDPEYLAQLPEPILRLWRQAEQAILNDMARRIATYSFWIPAAAFQNERLLAAGRTQNEILAVLSEMVHKTEPQLREMMIEAGSRCLKDDVEIYKAAGLTPPKIAESKELTAILNDGYKATLGTMQNITKTTARTATHQFEAALDRAWLSVSSGAFDYQSAIRNAVKELSAAGIAAIKYPSGRTDSLETSIRRAVLTGLNQTCGRLQIELMDEVGCEYVEVSAHAGARTGPGLSGPADHASWQGKIYRRNK